MYKTKIIQNNGLNPVWNEEVTYEAEEEEINMIVFKIFDDDNTILCWNALPIECLKEGIRVVEMKDPQLKELQGSSLLCHF